MCFPISRCHMATRSMKRRAHMDGGAADVETPVVESIPRPPDADDVNRLLQTYRCCQVEDE